MNRGSQFESSRLSLCFYRRQTVFLVWVTVMNFFGIIVLLILVIYNRTQDQNLATFTSTLSFDQFSTPLTSDFVVHFEQEQNSHQVVKNKKSEAFWIVQQKTTCCELQTELIPLSQVSLTISSPSLIQFEVLNNEKNEKMNVEKPPTTTEPENEYFGGFPSITIPANIPNSQIRPKTKIENLPIVKLLSNQEIGPPGIVPTEQITKYLNAQTDMDWDNQHQIGAEKVKIFEKSSFPTLMVISSTIEKSLKNLAELKPKSTTKLPTMAPSTASSLKTTKFSKTTSRIVADCLTESNKHKNHSCEEWRRAGYCESHPATKYIFCRKTCLCNF